MVGIEERIQNSKQPQETYVLFYMHLSASTDSMRVVFLLRNQSHWAGLGSLGVRTQVGVEFDSSE